MPACQLMKVPKNFLKFQHHPDHFIRTMLCITYIDRLIQDVALMLIISCTVYMCFLLHTRQLIF